jgi:DNA topoisomerase-2
MIIDGKLIVSKKKKSVLIAELKKLNFTPFPKASQAKKAGEEEDFAEDDAAEDAETDAETGANDYDYLLGMPIWSLTQERVERIKRQIGDKELEIDVIIKLSPKDLWIRDLDDFIESWHTTNAEDKARRKKVRQGGRRASAKLGTTGKIKKKKVRAESDDDDFEVGKKKSTALKAIQDRAKNKGKGSLWGNFLENGPAKAEEKPKVVELDDDDDFMDIDKIEQRPTEAQDEVSEVVAVKQKAPALVKKAPAKPAPVHLDSDDDDVFLAAAEEPIKKAVPARAARTTKPKKFVVSDDSDASDALGDITELVKPGGLGQSVSAAGRTLFTAPSTRPGSGHGLTSQKVAKKSKSKSPNDSDNGIDDTDFNGLLQGSPRRALTKPGESGMGLSDDEDDTLGMPIRKTSAVPKPKAPVSKPAAASKLVAKKPPLKKAVAAAPKITPLSPAAKAYAAKHGKGAALSKGAPKKKSTVDSDEEEELADDILSSDEDMDDAPVVARPSRRAATTKAKYAVREDSDEEDEESEEDYDEDEQSD